MASVTLSRRLPTCHDAAMKSVNRPSSVGVVGLAYVGLPLVVAPAEAGVDVVAVDNDASKVERLSRGESYIEDVDASSLLAVRDRIRATT